MLSHEKLYSVFGGYKMEFLGVSLWAWEKINIQKIKTIITSKYVWR
jgi:hypothetical protein